MIGWISETLNPLSGLRGPVVQPLPFPVPAKYRVILMQGAAIQSGVELASSHVGVAPSGALLTVVGRAYTDHPTIKCVVRLRLAGGRGWVSARTNLPLPRDDMVVELVGVDRTYDPERAGEYHLLEWRRLLQEYNDQWLLSGQQQGLAEEDGGEGKIAIGSASDQVMSLTTNAPASFEQMSSMTDLSLIPHGQQEHDKGPVSTRLEMQFLLVGGHGEGMHTGVRSQPPGQSKTCIICLTEDRNATIVHGTTGHIASCLVCARILKARGDRVSETGI